MYGQGWESNSTAVTIDTKINSNLVTSIGQNSNLAKLKSTVDARKYSKVRLIIDSYEVKYYSSTFNLVYKNSADNTLVSETILGSSIGRYGTGSNYIYEANIPDAAKIPNLKIELNFYWADDPTYNKVVVTLSKVSLF